MKAKEFFSFLKDKVVLQDLIKFLGGAISVAVILDTFEDKLSLPSWWFYVFIFISIASIIPYLIFRVHDRKMELQIGEKYQYKFNWKDNLTKFIVIYSTVCLLFLIALINTWNTNFHTSNYNVTKGLVLVDDFVNLTGNKELDGIGLRAKKSIIYYLKRNNVNVIPPREENKVKEFLGGENDIASLSLIPNLRSFMGHEFLITGDFSYVGFDSIEFTSEIWDSNDKIIKEFEPVIVRRSNFERTLSQLAQTITGYWTIRGKELDLMDPTIWNSREDWVNALDNWPNYDLALPFIKNSMENDSNFFAPIFLYCSYLRNTNSFQELDSMLVLLENRREEMELRDENLLDFYKAELTGNLTKANQLFVNEFLMDEKNWFYNTSMANYYLQNVNDPTNALETLNKINFAYDKSPYHKDRLRAKTDALLRLNRPFEAQEVLKEYEQFQIDQTLYALNARTLVQIGDVQSIAEFINDYSKKKITSTGKDIHELDLIFYIVREAYLFNKTEILLHYKGFSADNYDSTAVINYTPQIAGIYYYTGKENQINSLTHLKLNQFYKVKLGLEDITEAEIQEKLSVEQPYNFGQKKYNIAKLYLAKGNIETALQLLQEAYNEGARFYSYRYAYDPDLQDLFDHPEFQELVKTKG